MLTSHFLNSLATVDREGFSVLYNIHDGIKPNVRSKAFVGLVSRRFVSSSVEQIPAFE